MRIDKLTTKFQEALADAQSLAVTRDNPYMEPVHVLAAHGYGPVLLADAEMIELRRGNPDIGMNGGLQFGKAQEK